MWVVHQLAQSEDLADVEPVVVGHPPDGVDRPFATRRRQLAQQVLGRKRLHPGVDLGGDRLPGGIHLLEAGRRRRPAAGGDLVEDGRRCLALGACQEVKLLLPGQVANDPADCVDRLDLARAVRLRHATHSAPPLGAGEVNLFDERVRHASILKNELDLWRFPTDQKCTTTRQWCQRLAVRRAVSRNVRAWPGSADGRTGQHQGSSVRAGRRPARRHAITLDRLVLACHLQVRHCPAQQRRLADDMALAICRRLIRAVADDTWRHDLVGDVEVSLAEKLEAQPSRPLLPARNEFLIIHRGAVDSVMATPSLPAPSWTEKRCTCLSTRATARPSRRTNPVR